MDTRRLPVRTEDTDVTTVTERTLDMNADPREHVQRLVQRLAELAELDTDGRAAVQSWASCLWLDVADHVSFWRKEARAAVKGPHNQGAYIASLILTVVEVFNHERLRPLLVQLADSASEGYANGKADPFGTAYMAFVDECQERDLMHVLMTCIRTYLNSAGVRQPRFENQVALLQEWSTLLLADPTMIGLLLQLENGTLSLPKLKARLRREVREMSVSVHVLDPATLVKMVADFRGGNRAAARHQEFQAAILDASNDAGPKPR